MPVDCGSITPSSAQAATAASAAVPPERSTSIAVSAASGCDVATIAFWTWTVDRPAKWKFLIPSGSFLSFYRGFSIAGLHDLSGGHGQCFSAINAVTMSFPAAQDDVWGREKGRFLQV